MDNKKVADFWTGFIFAVAIAALIVFMKKDKILEKYGNNKRVAMEQKNNPNPTILKDFCKGADPDLKSGVLVKQMLKHIGHRICLQGTVRMVWYGDDSNMSNYHIMSDAWTITITVNRPPGTDEMFEIRDRIVCAGYEFPPIKGDHYDYYPRVDCAFIEHQDAGEQMLLPSLTDHFQDVGWRRSIVAESDIYDGMREIWMEPENDFSIEIHGTPEKIFQTTLRFEYSKQDIESDDYITWNPYETCMEFLMLNFPDTARELIEDWYMESMMDLELEDRGEKYMELDDKAITIIRGSYSGRWRIVVEPM